MERHRRLSLPTGTETLHLREAARHRAINRTLEDLFIQWGYHPAETPLVDYFDVYRPHIPESTVRTMYRAVDRQGEILAVRSDTTLFLARQLGLHVTRADLPVRVCYSDQIVRAEAADRVSNNEFQQAGVELVGLSGSDADAEVILLALEALGALGLTDAALHVGYRPLAAALLAPEHDRDDALARLHYRRGLTSDDSVALDDAARGALATIGPPSVLEQVRSATRENPEALSALDHFAGTLARVQQLAPTGAPELRVDLTEVGANGYYTGIAMSAYLADSNDAVLVGGRYDDLLGAFGFAAPSCGFAVYTRKLPARVARELSGIAMDERLPSELDARLAAIRSENGARR